MSSESLSGNSVNFTNRQSSTKDITKNNVRPFQKSALIFVMGCLFGMQVLNFQVSQSLSYNQHDAHAFVESPVTIPDQPKNDNDNGRKWR